MEPNGQRETEHTRYVCARIIVIIYTVQIPERVAVKVV